MELFGRAAILFERIREAADRSEGHVVFGSVHSQWSSGILSFLTQWAHQRPGVTWRLITGHSRELLDRIHDGALDAALTYLPGAQKGLQSTLIAEQRLALYTAHPAQGISCKAFTPSTVRTMPLAHLDWGPPFTSWFQRELEGWTPSVQVDQVPLLLEILMAGSYVGFLPAALAREVVLAGRLVELNYQYLEPIPSRSVYLVGSEQALDRAVVQGLWNHLITEGPMLFNGRLASPME